MDTADIAQGNAHLAAHNVTLESELTCNDTGGGTRLYFPDPDSHLLELITPGCWAEY